MEFYAFMWRREGLRRRRELLRLPPEAEGAAARIQSWLPFYLPGPRSAQLPGSPVEGSVDSV